MGDHNRQPNQSTNSTHADGAEAITLIWQKLGQEERALAMRLGLYAPAPIPLTVNQAEEWQESLERLAGVGLVERSQDFVVSLPPLVRQFVREQLEESPERETLRRAVAAIATDKELEQWMVYPTTPEEFAHIGFWIPHIKQVVGDLLDAVEDEHVTEPFVRLSAFYSRQGLDVESLPWNHQSLEVARDRLGANHPKTIEAMLALAMGYQHSREYKKAEPLLREILSIKRASLSPTDPELIRHLNNIAFFFSNEDGLIDYDAAKPFYEEIVAIAQANLPAAQRELYFALLHLERIHKRQKNYRDLEAVQRKLVDTGLRP